MNPYKTEIEEYFRHLQKEICKAIEDTDGNGQFGEDLWTRPEGGGGRTCILENGAIIEKGGVAFSAVSGPLHEKMLKNMGIEEKVDFFATGVSLVMHPKNPFVPIIHMNVRYFEMENGVCWFGGGIDLTPHYIDTADASFFHNHLKNTCDKHDQHYYERFKVWADDYFYNEHRQETRGIGGIFFDYLKPSKEKTKAELFDFVKNVGETFAPVYTQLMRKNAELPFEEKHKDWQLIRRSRYVEYNLVYDRGTKFGLETNGRIESILLSMPPMASWKYNHKPEPTSEEALTLSLLKKGINWLANN